MNFWSSTSWVKERSFTSDCLTSASRQLARNYHILDRASLGPRIPVAFMKILVGIPKPKNDMSSWWWLESWEGIDPNSACGKRLQPRDGNSEEFTNDFPLTQFPPPNLYAIYLSALIKPNQQPKHPDVYHPVPQSSQHCVPHNKHPFFFQAGLNRWTPSQHLHSTARRYGTKQGAHQKKSYEFWWFILDQLRFKPQFAPTAPAQCPKNLNYIKFATTELQAALGYPVGTLVFGTFAASKNGE